MTKPDPNSKPVSRPQYRGSLELTWTNKDQRLLSREDGGYEWVEPSDFRAAEVRLLHDAGTVGTVADDEKRAGDNLLIRGDALNALHSLASLPEFADEFVGKVKLVYIDPPFNTGQTFAQYDDGLEHSVWLTMMRDRLVQLKKLLSPEGSIWVHLNDDEQGYARILLDEVFGRDKFVATVIWQKRYSRENRSAFGDAHDYIMIYAPKGSDWKHHRNRLHRLEAKEYGNPNNDPKGPWRGIPFTAQGHRANQKYTITAPNGKTHVPPKGRCWGAIETTFREHEAAGRVWWGVDGNAQPQLIRYLADDEGLVPMTWWPHEEVGHTDGAKKEVLALIPDAEPFDTPKPERLMERILHVGSDPGDIVLDCFAGSGTTAAVAHKMGRRWVTIEHQHATVETYLIPRLTSVITGADQGGFLAGSSRTPVHELPEGVSPHQAYEFTGLLRRFARLLPDEELFGSGGDGEAEAPPKDELEREALLRQGAATLMTALQEAAKTRTIAHEGWTGGGGFRVLNVGQSMFVDDEGVVVIAEWAANNALAEATAAQFGYAYAPDAPFAGRKGRFRLAVIDGNVSASVVRLLVGALAPDQKLLVCGTSLDPDADATLRALNPGSEARKVPASILADYRLAHRWQVQQVLPDQTPEEVSS